MQLSWSQAQANNNSIAKGIIMKDFNNFVKAVQKIYPDLRAHLLACPNGYDLTYRGLYQRGYSDVLETRSGHYVQTMSEHLFGVFEVWRRI